MTALLELRGISKSFAATVALDGFSIELHPGEIHGLVGENGAGKSTLIKIMTGVHQPSSGEILVDGVQRTIDGPGEAQALGVLDDPGEGRDGGRIVDVPLLGEVGHQEVMADQPGDQLRAFALKPQPPAGHLGRLGAGDLLAAFAALAGVVQQHGQEEGLAVGDQGGDGDRQRVVLLEPSGRDVGDHAHGP